MARHNPRRTILLSTILGALLLFEAYLLTAFLPDNWQRTISRQFARLSEQSYQRSLVTHPLLEEEIRQTLEQHPGFEIALDLTFGVVLAGNTFLVAKTWRALRSGSGKT
jgi:hypothetical protein